MRSLFRSKHKVTQEFGVNADYYKQFGLKAHEGIDLIPTGTVWDVLCLADGVVVKDEDNVLSGAYGNYVTVWHPKLRKATQYCHFKENYVVNGQVVSMGEKLGLMGKTGNTSGAHVHLNLFETDENGIRLNRTNGYLGGVDPLPFLEEEVPVEVAPDTVPVPKPQLEDFQRVKEGWNKVREKLNVEDNVTVVLAEIDKLITYEDAVVQKDKQLQDTQAELSEVKMRLGLLTDSHDALQSSYNDLQGQLNTDKDTIDTLTKNLAELEAKIIQPVYKGWKKALIDFISKI